MQGSRRRPTRSRREDHADDVIKPKTSPSKQQPAASSVGEPMTLPRESIESTVSEIALREAALLSQLSYNANQPLLGSKLPAISPDPEMDGDDEKRQDESEEQGIDKLVELAKQAAAEAGVQQSQQLPAKFVYPGNTADQRYHDDRQREAPRHVDYVPPRVSLPPPPPSLAPIREPRGLAAPRRIPWETMAHWTALLVSIASLLIVTAPLWRGVTVAPLALLEPSSPATGLHHQQAQQHQAASLVIPQQQTVNARSQIGIGLRGSVHAMSLESKLGLQTVMNARHSAFTFDANDEEAEVVLYFQKVSTVRLADVEADEMMQLRRAGKTVLWVGLRDDYATCTGADLILPEGNETLSGWTSLKDLQFHPTISWLYFSKDSTTQQHVLLPCNDLHIQGLLNTLNQIYPERVAKKLEADLEMDLAKQDIARLDQTVSQIKETVTLLKKQLQREALKHTVLSMKLDQLSSKHDVNSADAVDAAESFQVVHARLQARARGAV